MDSVLKIGRHMIQARIYEVLCKPQYASDEELEANSIVEIDGYQFAKKHSKKVIPRYLDIYPEIRSSLEHGYATGFIAFGN